MIDLLSSPDRLIRHPLKLDIILIMSEKKEWWTRQLVNGLLNFNDYHGIQRLK